MSLLNNSHVCYYMAEYTRDFFDEYDVDGAESVLLFVADFYNIIKTLKVGLLILSSLIHTPPSLMGEGVVKEIQKFSKTHSNIFWGNVTQPV